MELFHYTTLKRGKAIRSQKVWHFRTHQPPVPEVHPKGVYFTDLPPDTIRLATKLRIPVRKTRYFFHFRDLGDWAPLDRKERVFFSRKDYHVEKAQQIAHGARPDA